MKTRKQALAGAAVPSGCDYLAAAPSFKLATVADLDDLRTAVRRQAVQASLFRAYRCGDAVRRRCSRCVRALRWRLRPRASTPSSRAEPRRTLPGTNAAWTWCAVATSLPVLGADDCFHRCGEGPGGARALLRDHPALVCGRGQPGGRAVPLGSSTWAVCVQVAAPTDAGVRNALHRLCRLFALSHLQDNAGEWIGILSAAQLALVLCLRTHAQPAGCGLMRDVPGRSARPCASCLLKSARMRWLSAMCALPRLVCM